MPFIGWTSFRAIFFGKEEKEGKRRGSPRAKQVLTRSSKESELQCSSPVVKYDALIVLPANSITHSDAYISML